MKRAALSLLTIFLVILAGSLSAERIYFNESAKASDFGVNAISIFSTEIDFTIPYCDVESKDGYSVIKMDEYGSFSETEGFPALPVVVKTIAMPDQGDLEYEIVGYKETELKGTYKIYPMQPPMPEVVGFKPTFVKDDDAYSVNAVYPSSNVVISDPAIIRDVRFSKVYIYPYRYNPVTGKVYVMTEGTIVLKVNASKSTGESPVSNVLTEEFNDLYKGMFDNYDALAGYKSVETAVDRSMKYSNTKGTSFSGEGDYLIVVAGSATASKIYSYAAYKAKLGYKPSIIHLTSGSSMAQIKATVQNAYTNWTLKPIYVLLVGDGDSTLSTATNSVLQVNWKKASDFGISYNYGIKAGYIPNDHYYSLVSGTDYYADVYVSRFNCKDTITLNTIMNKTIAYETNPPLSNPTWFTHCISLAGKESGRIFDTTAVKFWKNLQAYGWTHWDSLVETSSWTPSQAQVTDSMNDGSNVMLFRGHGAEGYDGDSDDGSGYAWFGGADKGYITMCTNEMIAAMNNPTGECGFNFSPTCLAGNFAYPSTVRDSSSMGDYWTQRNTKGGIGLYAATNVSLSFYNDSMSLGVSHGITGDVAKREFARLCVYSKIYMEKYAGSASYFQLEAYLMNPLGDPAAVMYTKAPKKLTASHESAVEARLDTITITITDGTKAAVSGATVCLYDTLETTPIQQIATTDASGKAVFIATYTKTGTIFISASKQDYVPYMGTVSINAATAKNEIALTGSFSENGIVLNWNASGDADNIVISRKSDGVYKRIAALSSDEKSYTDKEFIDGRNDYRVSGYRNGSEIFSSAVSVSSLSIKENLSVMQSGNGYSIEFISSHSGEASYDIIDRSGRIIENASFSCRIGRNSISLPYLSGGIYFVRVHSGQNVLTSRFVSVK